MITSQFWAFVRQEVRRRRLSPEDSNPANFKNTESFENLFPLIFSPD